MNKRALLVGAGSMGRAWARNLVESNEVVLAGWIDVSESTLKAAIEETGISPDIRSTELKEGLNCKPDFIVDVTPPDVHHRVTIASLEAGIPVLGEKPMAADLDQAREMVRKSEQSGRLYMVSQSRRYNAGLRTLRSVCETRLGRLGILNADFFLGPHFGGFRDEMKSPLLLDMAIHTFDAARYVAASDARNVYAEEFNPGWSWYRGNASANALFEFKDDARFAYRGSWCAEGKMTSWEAEWRAVGEHGTALWDGVGPVKAEIVRERSGFFSSLEEVVEHPEPIAEGIRGSLVEFLWALHTGGIPSGECHDNFKSLAMVFSAIDSARLGVRVSVPER